MIYCRVNQSSELVLRGSVFIAHTHVYTIDKWNNVAQYFCGLQNVAVCDSLCRKSDEWFISAIKLNGMGFFKDITLSGHIVERDWT